MRDDVCEIGENTVRCIGHINLDQSVDILSIENHTEDIVDNNLEEDAEWLHKILENIENRTAVAALDTLMEGEYIVSHWIISIKDNAVETMGRIKLTKWNTGLILAGEGLGLLALIKHIINNTRQLEQGKIVIYNDNKKLIREIDKVIVKDSEYTKEAGMVIAQIRKEIEYSKICVKIEYSNNKLRSNLVFEQ